MINFWKHLTMMQRAVSLELRDWIRIEMIRYLSEEDPELLPLEESPQQGTHVRCRPQVYGNLS
jgi:hypothetical protein